MSDHAKPAAAAAGSRPSRRREAARFAAVALASFAALATSPRRWQLTATHKGSPMVVGSARGVSADVVVKVTPAPSSTTPITQWSLGVRVNVATSLQGGSSAGAGRVRLSLLPSAASSAAKEFSLPAPETANLYAQESLSSCAPAAPCERTLRLLAERVSGGAVEIEPEAIAYLEGIGADPPAGAAVSVRVVPRP